jgi:hypothetical protein
MSINVYATGSLVRLTASFTSADDGSAIDPDGVTLRVKPPSGVAVTYTYLVDVGLVRDMLGSFHFDVDATAQGRYFYHWKSTGAGQAAFDGEFVVKPQAA